MDMGFDDFASTRVGTCTAFPEQGTTRPGQAPVPATPSDADPFFGIVVAFIASAGLWALLLLVGSLALNWINPPI